MPYESRLSDADLGAVEQILRDVDGYLAARYPGERAAIQPLHTVYVSAADASPDLPDRWGSAATTLLDGQVAVLAELADSVLVTRVRDALERNPIQDLRLDFEDGYGLRDDATEDADARRAGAVLGALNGLRACGIRIKGLTVGEWERATRTLELVLDAAGGVPAGFVFTIPKFRAVEQVSAAIRLCAALERAHGLTSGALQFELQIESPQAVIAADGTVTLARAISIAEGRCTGLHYGTYDYSAACGIAAQYQALDHPVADHAKGVMLAAAAQTGVWVADGSTQIAPTGDGPQVEAALRRHYALVTRALERGYYQGWDMHPDHLVTRWLANFAFYRSAADAAIPRLDAYVERRAGGVVDEPATAEALARVVLRGLDCGAFDGADVAAPERPVLEDLVQRRPVRLR